MMMKQYNTPMLEMICLNSADVITWSGEDGILSGLFDSVDGASGGNTYTGDAPTGWGM